MFDLIEKIVCVFVVIVFITFLIRHGEIDFSGVDFVTQKTKDVVNSAEGQEIINEWKDISVDVLEQITDEVKSLVTKAKKDNERINATLVRVVDGDTIVVMIGADECKIRLIGIDTPESVNPDESKNNVYGTLSSEHTKEILKNVQNVYLEFDESLADEYGRLLAYVWLTDENITTTDNIKNEMLNGIILADGYAVNKDYKPNSKYKTALSSICKEAKENSEGLWDNADFTNLMEVNYE